MKKFGFQFCSPKNRAPQGAVVVNATSVSRDFGVNFSPMIAQGPITIGGLTAQNVENIYQYTKVYKEHENDPKAWTEWRNNGLKNMRGVRYPMGKGAKPEFAFLNKTLGRLDEVGSRKHIYIPAYIQKLDLYCQRQVNTLLDMLSVMDIWIWDFDVYPTTSSFEELVEDKTKSLGHGFVLVDYVNRKRGIDELQKRE